MFDRDDIGRGKPACPKRQRTYFEVGVQQLQASIRQFVLDDCGRDDGDAEALDGHVNDGRKRGAGVQPDRRQIGPVEQCAYRLIGLGFPRKGDDRIFREILPRHTTGADPERGTCQETNRVIAQHAIVHGRGGYRSQHKGQLYFLREQPGAQIRRDVDFDLERQIRIGFVDAFDEPRQPRVHDGLGDAEPQHTAHRGAIANLGHHLRAQADQLFRIHHHLPSARRR